MFSYRKRTWRLTMFALSAFVISTTTYKPVVQIHGLLGKPSSFKVLEKNIAKAHPNTEVISLSCMDGFKSLKPMWKQVNNLLPKLKSIMERSPNGIHLICYSQGGLLCRATLSLLPDHNVDTFISLASPQMGQYGVPATVKHWLPWSTSSVYKICYSKIGQSLSVCNYWNDPKHRGMYNKYSKFLSVLNNQTHNTKAGDWKRNFLRINNLVLIGSPADEVLKPWQSSLFATYDENMNILNMVDQEVYTRDTFGLRTLRENRRLTECIVPGIMHHKFPKNISVFENCIKKWLT